MALPSHTRTRACHRFLSLFLHSSLPDRELISHHALPLFSAAFASLSTFTRATRDLYVCSCTKNAERSIHFSMIALVAARATLGLNELSESSTSRSMARSTR